MAIVPSVLPTHRYRLRIVRLTHGRKPLREQLAILWDKRRVLPACADDFFQSLAAYMRDVFPISRPAGVKRRRGSRRSRALEKRSSANEGRRVA